MGGSCTRQAMKCRNGLCSRCNTQQDEPCLPCRVKQDLLTGECKRPNCKAQAVDCWEHCQCPKQHIKGYCGGTRRCV
eukprot:10303-Eustigmatos_ZCMA.PRE.1